MSQAHNESAWQKLRRKIKDEQFNHLYKDATQVVFGDGSLQAKVIFIGEAPGAKEDLQGKPFVGRSGLLLTKLLNSIELDRKDVYITNVVKCRPPDNRKPTPKEIKICLPHLKEEISLIHPQVIVALGKTAAQALLDDDAPMNQLRGEVHAFFNKDEKYKLIVTYHPAYLLRFPGEKQKAYDDMEFLKHELRQS